MRLRRRHHRGEAELNITAFLNLMVILIPFLLLTTAFSRFAILDIYLPPASEAQIKTLKELQLEVIIRDDALEVGDRNGGLIKRISNGPDGYDLLALNAILVQLKTRFPEKRNIFILSEPQTNYDVMIQVMDAVRVTDAMDDGTLVQAELFPDISLGDAPPQPNAKRKTARGKAS